MDRIHFRGWARQIVGALKEIAGRLLGDKRLTANGRAERVVGKILGATGRGGVEFKP